MRGGVFYASGVIVRPVFVVFPVSLTFVGLCVWCPRVFGVGPGLGGFAGKGALLGSCGLSGVYRHCAVLLWAGAVCFGGSLLRGLRLFLLFCFFPLFWGLPFRGAFPLSTKPFAYDGHYGYFPYGRVRAGIGRVFGTAYALDCAQGGHAG